MQKYVEHKQNVEIIVRILSREEWEKEQRELEHKDVKPIVNEKASFTQTFIYWLMEYGIGLINAPSIKAELRDPNGGLIKTFTSLNELSVATRDTTDVGIKVRIIDSSSDSYTFRYLNVNSKRGEEEAMAIRHTFLQNYTKGSDQIADITVITYVTGCVA